MKWTTNEKCIQKEWEEKEDDSQSKVLGYAWNRDEDTFQVKVPEEAIPVLYPGRNIY